MLDTIKSFFEHKLATPNASETSPLLSQIDLACAALMIEVMNSDHELDARESAEFVAVLQQHLDVSPEDIEEITGLARKEAQQATSLYEFTSLINESYDYQQKLGLISNMWRIAFSDAKLDKYEDHLIRKIAELIYVTHTDFIRTKLEAKEARDAGQSAD